MYINTYIFYSPCNTQWVERHWRYTQRDIDIAPSNSPIRALLSI